MASIVDRSGTQARPAGAIIVDNEVASRTRDAIIVRLKGNGLSYRTIGMVLGMTKQSVHERYHTIPEAVRRHYAAVPMG